MNRADDVIESQAALRREGKHVARVRGLRTLQALLQHSSPKRPAPALQFCALLPLHSVLDHCWCRAAEIRRCNLARPPAAANALAVC